MVGGDMWVGSLSNDIHMWTVEASWLVLGGGGGGESEGRGGREEEGRISAV